MSSTRTRSRRAPSARRPARTTCWAVEQHHDVARRAARHRPGRVPAPEPRPRGRRGPDRPGLRADRRARDARERRERDRLGQAAARRRGDRHRAPAGGRRSRRRPARYVRINADGTGTIVTGAQECGTGAVMALPILAAEVLGMRPEEFRILYQDTDAGPYDGGASGSPDDVQQRPRGHRRRERGPRAAPRPRGRAAGGEPGRPRARRRHGPGQGQHHARRSRSRSWRRRPPRARAAPRQGLGRAAADAGRRRRELRRPARRSSRSPRRRSSPTPSASRSTATPASCGSSRSRRPTSRASSSTRSARRARSTAASRWASARRSPRASSSPTTAGSATPTSSTTSSRPWPTSRRSHVDFVDAPSPNGGPKGLKGIGEPPCVPTPGAIANAIAARGRGPGRRAADDAGARLGRHRDEERRRLTWRGRFSRPDGAGRRADGRGSPETGRSPAGPTSWSATRQGKWSLPERPRRDRPDRGAARDRRDRGRAADRGDDEPRRPGRQPGGPRPLDGDRRRRVDRRVAGHAPRRARSAATSRTRRRPPRRADRCSVSMPTWSSRSASGERRIARRGPVHRSRPDQPRARTSSSSPSSCRRRRGRRAAATSGSSSAGRWRSRSSAPRRVVTPRRRGRPRRADRDHRARADRPPRGRGRGRARRHVTAGPRPQPRPAAWPPRPRPDLRRPGLARLSPGDGRGGRAARHRGRGRPGPRRDRADPGQRQPRSESSVTVRHPATLHGQRRRATPSRSRPAGRCSRSCAASSG